MHKILKPPLSIVSFFFVHHFPHRIPVPRISRQKKKTDVEVNQDPLAHTGITKAVTLSRVIDAYQISFTKSSITFLSLDKIKRSGGKTQEAETRSINQP
jgi:hypothetical protein